MLCFSAYADAMIVPVLGKMPIDMDYATKADGGFFAAIDNQYITDALAVMPK